MSTKLQILDQLWKIYSNFQELIRHADSKAQINIAIASIFISIATPFIQHFSLLPRTFMVLSLITIVLSAVSSLYAIYPRLEPRKNEEPSPFFFKSLAKNPQIIDKFEDTLRNGGNYSSALRQDIVTLAMILTKKFGILRIASILLITGVIMGGLSEILFILGF